MKCFRTGLIAALLLPLAACMPSTRAQRRMVYDDRVADCREFHYDVFECRRMYGCDRRMGPEECGAKMLEVLNDPQKVDVF